MRFPVQTEEISSTFKSELCLVVDIQYRIGLIFRIYAVLTVVGLDRWDSLQKARWSADTLTVYPTKAQHM